MNEKHSKWLTFRPQDWLKTNQITTPIDHQLKKETKTMKTKIILTIVGTAIFFGGELFAQRMPQDSWYLYKEFRGDIEGGKFTTTLKLKYDSPYVENFLIDNSSKKAEGKQNWKK